MKMVVREGDFIESPTAGARGMDRRAFGEFVSPRGEMASYAIGWDSTPDRHVGRLTVGIGAGNPGGGTFHAVIFPNEGSYAFALVDEPFERVPQGGPDLTAAEAREHPDIRFVWWVADEVMARDRRARWLQHWLLGTSAIQTPEVFDLREPILLVVHEEDDGLWQLIGRTDAGDDGRIQHLHHAIEADPTLLDVLDLAPGYCAERDVVGGRWKRDVTYPPSDPG
ncbi:hypothetical protein [Nocardioides speluncae]|uniref:hypothetical protein n=1 Tax=Nocardioides speluncae TaxID=2670337 RepID=UPI000D699DB8|nr:hypothetical protein [Nocardioides speluncae]